MVCNAAFNSHNGELMRYSENPSPTAQPQHFIPRNRSSVIWRVIIGFIVALVAMLALNLVPNLVGGEPEASLLSMVVISILCFYIVYLKQQNLDLVMQTEFQNLLFAQAAAMGTVFCMFVKRNGEVAYVSRGLRDIAPDLSERYSGELGSLLEKLDIEDHIRQGVQSAVFALEKKVIPISIKYNNTQYALNFEIYPLSRPSGYAVIKAIAASASQVSSADLNQEIA